MVFTLCGDVRNPGVYELPLGFSLRDLIFGIGGGPPKVWGSKTRFHSVLIDAGR